MDERLTSAITADLIRQARWSEIVPFLEKNLPSLEDLKHRSLLTYDKNILWLRGTERLTITQFIVLKHLRKEAPLTQGALVRLLGGNPRDKDLSPEGKLFIQKENNHWVHQIRDNIQPIMGKYFALLRFEHVGEDKPGHRGYNIFPSELLVRFFTEVLYK